MKLTTLRDPLKSMRHCLNAGSKDKKQIGHRHPGFSRLQSHSIQIPVGLLQCSKFRKPGCVYRKSSDDDDDDDDDYKDNLTQ